MGTFASPSAIVARGGRWFASGATAYSWERTNARPHRRARHCQFGASRRRRRSAAFGGAVLVRALAIGVCGTDREIVCGHYGWAPPGQTRLVIGHELLGVVRKAPPGCGVNGRRSRRRHRAPARPGAMPACAVGEWDMCRNGRYTERGIKERNGFGSEFFRIEPDFLIKVDASLGHCRRVARTDQRRRQGLGSHRAHRRSARAHGNRKRCW